jgi:hypothetical protein
LPIRESFTREGIPLYFIETLILVAPIVADVGIETVPLTGELEVAQWSLLVLRIIKISIGIKINPYIVLLNFLFAQDGVQLYKQFLLIHS